MEIIVIVPRYVRALLAFRGRVELFLPYGQATQGFIETWHPHEGHNEASLDYYRGTRPPWDCKREAEDLVERYKALLPDLFEDHPYEVRVRQRFPNDWREHAWRRT